MFTIFSHDFSNDATAGTGGAGSTIGTTALIDKAGSCWSVAGSAGSRRLHGVATAGGNSYYQDIAYLPTNLNAIDTMVEVDFTFTTGMGSISTIHRWTSGGSYYQLIGTTGASGVIAFRVVASTGVTTTIGSAGTATLTNAQAYRLRTTCTGSGATVALGIALTSLDVSGNETPVSGGVISVADTSGSRVVATGQTGVALNSAAVDIKAIRIYNLAATVTTTTASGDALEITAADATTSTTPVVLVIGAHGYTGDQAQFRTIAELSPLIAPLTNAGYLFAAGNFAGDNWGNDAAQAALLGLITKAQTLYNVVGIVPYGVSMGGLVSLLTLINDADSRLGGAPIYGCALNSPVTDLDWANQQAAYTASSDTAYGGHAALTAALPTHNPESIIVASGTAAHSLPMRFYVGASDTSVPPANNTTPFVAALTASEKVVRSVTGAHVPMLAVTGDQTADLVTFLNRITAGTVVAAPTVTVSDISFSGGNIIVTYSVALPLYATSTVAKLNGSTVSLGGTATAPTYTSAYSNTGVPPALTFAASNGGGTGPYTASPLVIFQGGGSSTTQGGIAMAIPKLIPVNGGGAPALPLDTNFSAAIQSQNLGLFVTGAGNVTFTDVAGDVITTLPVTAGQTISVQCKQVASAGLTATVSLMMPNAFVYA